MVDPGVTRNDEKHRSVERSDEGDHEQGTSLFCSDDSTVVKLTIYRNEPKRRHGWERKERLNEPETGSDIKISI